MLFLYVVSIFICTLIAVLFTNFSIYTVLLGTFIGVLLVVIYGLLKD